jgi:hypothetical protein
MEVPIMLKAPKFTIGLLALAACTVVSMTSHAAINSGGGKAVVCRSSSGSIRSAELLDLFEAERAGISLARLPRAVDYYRLFMSRYLSLMGARPTNESDATIAKYIKDVLTANWVVYVGRGENMPTTNDYNGPTQFSGCKVEQLAVFRDDQVTRSYQLIINLEIWNALDSRDQMGLLAHEFIYRSNRFTEGDKASDRSRQLVGYLFSAQALN